MMHIATEDKVSTLGEKEVCTYHRGTFTNAEVAKCSESIRSHEFRAFEEQIAVCSEHSNMRRIPIESRAYPRLSSYGISSPNLVKRKRIIAQHVKASRRECVPYLQAVRHGVEAGDGDILQLRQGHRHRVVQIQRGGQAHRDSVLPLAGHGALLCVVERGHVQRVPLRAPRERVEDAKAVVPRRHDSVVGAAAADCIENTNLVIVPAAAVRQEGHHNVPLAFWAQRVAGKGRVRNGSALLGLAPRMTSVLMFACLPTLVFRLLQVLYIQQPYPRHQILHLQKQNRSIQGIFIKHTLLF